MLSNTPEPAGANDFIGCALSSRRSNTRNPTPDKKDPGNCEGFQDHLLEAIPHLRRYARVLLRNGDPADAEDLVQECLLRALAKRNTLAPDSRVKAWLFTIMHNLYVSQVRQAVRKQHQQRLLHTGHGPVASPPPDAYVEYKAFTDALTDLPGTQSNVIRLIVLEGLSYAEVANIVDVPVGTVRSRLSRGREVLRRSLYYQEETGQALPVPA